MFCFFFLKEMYGFYNKVLQKLNYQNLHQLLVNYNKNILPIEGFDFYTVDFKKSFSAITALYERNQILSILKKYPSVLVRNIKKDLQKVRNFHDINSFLDQVEYMNANLTMFYGRDESIIKKIEPKIYSSKNNTIDKINNFFDDYINNTENFSLSEYELNILLDEKGNDIHLKYENTYGKIIEAHSQEAIARIGCNSMWCFSSKGAYHDFYNFSTNDMVYVIFDKRDNSLYVLTGFIEKSNNKDWETNLYDIYNRPVSYQILKELFGRNYRKYFTFE
jgi:hypothetical protein